MGTHTHTHTKKLYLRKIHVFVIDKYIEDVKQDEKSVPDLLESIMMPIDNVKEELRMKTMKMKQFRHKIIGGPENRRIPAGGQHSLLAQWVLSLFDTITAFKAAINPRNAGFSAVRRFLF